MDTFLLSHPSSPIPHASGSAPHSGLYTVVRISINVRGKEIFHFSTSDFLTIQPTRTSLTHRLRGPAGSIWTAERPLRCASVLIHIHIHIHTACMLVGVCARMYACASACVCGRLCVCVCARARARVGIICACMFCMCACMFACVRVCLHVCMCIRTSTDICTYVCTGKLPVHDISHGIPYTVPMRALSSHARASQMSCDRGWQ
jgi:hypothetical protein